VQAEHKGEQRQPQPAGAHLAQGTRPNRALAPQLLLLLAQQLLQLAPPALRAVEAHQHRVTDHEGGHSRSADARPATDLAQLGQGLGIALQAMQLQLPGRLAALQLKQIRLSGGAVGTAPAHIHVQHRYRSLGARRHRQGHQDQQQSHHQGEPSGWAQARPNRRPLDAWS